MCASQSPWKSLESLFIYFEIHKKTKSHDSEMFTHEMISESDIKAKDDLKQRRKNSIILNFLLKLETF